MTTDSVPVGGDPHQLLSDVRNLARRVRRDQRVTWAALLVLAAATLVMVPVDRYLLDVNCVPTADGSRCEIWHRGAAFFWPVALLAAYAAIAASYVRVARTRGLGTRVLPYAITGATGAALYIVAGLLVRQYLLSHPVPAEPFPYWAMLLDRLIAPGGTIGIALLVLARLERNIPLLGFTLGYLAVVLTPITFDVGPHWWTPQDTMNSTQQIINGTVLLLGAIGFAAAARRQR